MENVTETSTKTSAKSAMGGSVVEVVAGIGAVALAILGLLRISPANMASIATILAGVALLFEGVAVAGRFRQVAPTARGSQRERAQIGGTGMEVVGGIVGIALGVLALFGVAPMFLIPIGLIVFGGSLMFGSAGTARVHATEPRGEKLGRAASGVQLVIGIVAVALGILALLEIAPTVLSLVGLLIVGATVLLSGSALGARLGRSLQTHRPRHA